MEARPTPLITLRLEAATMTQFSLPLRPNPAPLAKRLAAQIMKPEGEDGCWLWTGPVFTATGYGQIRLHLGARPTTAHRAMWQSTHGPIPEGLCVLHRCDVRPCVNPAHLFLGTRAENTADMIAKGRAPARMVPQETTCRNGHVYAEHGRHIDRRTGKRTCRACAAAWQRAHPKLGRQ